MESVRIRTEPAYDALVAPGLLDRAGELSARAVKGRRVMIAADEHVAPLYLERTRRSFEAAGFRTAEFVFPAGEGAKSLATAEKMLEAATAAELTRSDLFAALGGGVTGDLTGLAAALYQRGVDFVQIPTTLLAMVDASVGGKTAVNLASGKNLCGAFHQPRLVLCDTDTLETLARPVFAEGMAEVIKHGALSGGELLDRIQERQKESGSFGNECFGAGKNGDGEKGDSLEKLIAENIRFKSSIVVQDEREKGLRQLLNLGHTFGHAVEKLNGFAIFHGEGVSIGMMIAARTAEDRGICPPGIFAELREMLTAEGLPVRTRFTAAEVAEAARNDKKRRGDEITLVLPEARGRCRLMPVGADALADFIGGCDGTVTGCP